jgi:hypothetical protein
MHMQSANDETTDGSTVKTARAALADQQSSPDGYKVEACVGSTFGSGKTEVGEVEGRAPEESGYGYGV